jgi:hypothetical protein
MNSNQAADVMVPGGPVGVGMKRVEDQPTSFM